MSIGTSYLKRFLTDAAGYGLVLLGLALGWLPGPTGLPLILLGLGLLSIHNAWARRLRRKLLQGGGQVARRLFPAHPAVRLAYDAAVVLLLAAVTVLLWRHESSWHIGAAISLLFLALAIAGLNYDRLARLKKHFNNHK